LAIGLVLPSLAEEEAMKAIRVLAKLVPTVVLTAGCGASSSAPPATPATPPGGADDVTASLSGLRLELPCKGPKIADNQECHWDPAYLQTDDKSFTLKKEISKTLGGKPELIYDVTVRIRGVVEPKNFTGGTIEKDHFQIGGSPVVDHYNLYQLKVSDPPQTYTVNRHQDKVGHFVFPIDITATIPIRGGASVTMGEYDTNDIAIANFKNMVVDGIPPSPAPYDGQFFQVDVLSAKAQGSK
jgi:hypothetical protein